ncbi:hypothetical protein CRYUN_Cryun04dG0082100 [Craigia yunnanensis]
MGDNTKVLAISESITTNCINPPHLKELMYKFIYCYKLGVKYLTAYAFSIDNFKRKPNEVQKIMDLLKESITLLTRIAKHRPVRVHFARNLELLSADLKDAARDLWKLKLITLNLCSQSVFAILARIRSFMLFKNLAKKNVIIFKKSGELMLAAGYKLRMEIFIKVRTL